MFQEIRRRWLEASGKPEHGLDPWVTWMVGERASLLSIEHIEDAPAIEPFAAFQQQLVGNIACTHGFYQAGRHGVSIGPKGHEETVLDPEANCRGFGLR